MRAGQTTLRQLIGGEKQYRVPLFQRPYTWTGQELQDLWEDLIEQHSNVLSMERTGIADNRFHFIGGFVVAPQAMLPHGVAPYLIIDGQQRLTTLLLALAAMRDVLRNADVKAAQRLDVYYLQNQSAEGLDRYKVLPTQDDRAVFFSCIDGEGPGSADTRVAAAYRFFHTRVGQPTGDESDARVDPEVLSRVILDRLSIIDIVTESGDNPNRIFESLNATGVRLTQADLLRNFIFMLLPSRQEEVYRTLWKPMERTLGDENLEGFARYDLLRRGIDAQRDEVYRKHQDRLEPMAGDEAKIEAEVRELVRLAGYYRRLVDPRTESDAELQKHLTFLRRWGAQTTYPVLLHAYDLLDRRIIEIEHMRSVARTLESFLVRRYLLGVSTNFLNRLFVDLVKQLPADESIAEALRHQLSADRRYWPTDDQIRHAVRSRPLYITGRADQRRAVFERLEESYSHQEPADLSASLTIEHVMPQTLTDEWRQLLGAQGEDPDQVHEELVHTLGNLTLTGYNSALSNNPYERKRQMFESSHLELNREIRDYPSWGRTEILQRADRLAGRTNEIWPGPVAGAKGAILGFDWTRIDAAVEAIPTGRWTAYGDLAALGGTSPQAVGNRMLSNAALRCGYRVLDAQGRIVEAFRWADPNDIRDVRDVLITEGIRFDSDGRADQNQRINVLELAQLVAFEFDPDDLDRLQRTFRPVNPPSDGIWLTDGRSWHLEHQCSPLTRDILLAFEGLVREAAPHAADISWSQKSYVSWRRRGRIWMMAQPRQSWIWIDLVSPPFTPEVAADLLGFTLVPEGESPSWRLNGPSQVQAGSGRVWIQLRTLADVEGARRSALIRLIQQAAGSELKSAVGLGPPP